MKTTDLTIVETRGNHVERAAQFGEAVRSNYAAMLDLFAKYRPLVESDQGQRIFTRVRERFSKDCTEVLPCMDAFARGVGVTRDDVLELNVMVMLGKSRLSECSGFAITRERQTVLGQNWDTSEEAAPMAVLEVGRNAEGPDTVRFTSALTLDFWAGINPHGLACGGASGPSGDPMGDGEGITGTLWRAPVFYSCEHVEDVKRQLAVVPNPGKGFNAVYVDSHDRMLWTQQGGGRHGVRVPTTPYAAATGYRPDFEEPRNAKEKANKVRWERFMALGKEAMDSNRELVDSVKQLLADHHVVDDHSDTAPCRHGGPENSTQFSLVFDLSARMAYYCGRPCENEWRHIVLS